MKFTWGQCVGVLRAVLIFSLIAGAGLWTMSYIDRARDSAAEAAPSYRITVEGSEPRDVQGFITVSGDKIKISGPHNREVINTHGRPVSITRIGYHVAPAFQPE